MHWVGQGFRAWLPSWNEKPTVHIEYVCLELGHGNSMTDIHDGSFAYVKIVFLVPSGTRSQNHKLSEAFFSARKLSELRPDLSRVIYKTLF